MTNPEIATQSASLLEKEEKDFLEKLIGFDREKHEYYVRCVDGAFEIRHGIWYLVPLALRREWEEAYERMKTHYDMSEEEAKAAWLFCNRFPKTSSDLANKKNFSWPGKNWKYKREKDPRKLLNLTP